MLLNHGRHRQVRHVHGGQRGRRSEAGEHPGAKQQNRSSVADRAVDHRMRVRGGRGGQHAAEPVGMKGLNPSATRKAFPPAWTKFKSTVRSATESGVMPTVSVFGEPMTAA